MARKDLDIEISLANSPFVTQTKGIVISVVPTFSPEDSQIDHGIFVYRYTIRIRNDGSETAQLINRHWIIKDSLGNTEEVHGEGVVGNKPVLGPGQEFTYSSFCPLKTPTGSMAGSYEMKVANGSTFRAEIGEFYFRDSSLIN